MRFKTPLTNSHPALESIRRAGIQPQCSGGNLRYLPTAAPQEVWKLKFNSITLQTIFFSCKHFNLQPRETLPAPCCKAIPFIFPLTMALRPCFKTKKRTRNTLSLTLLQLCLYVTLILSIWDAFYFLEKVFSGYHKGPL